jgi:epidermal growth factor receptor kinase substrate 8
MMAQIKAAKLKSKPRPEPTSAPPAASSSNDLLSALKNASKANLRKTEPVARDVVVEPSNPLMAEMMAKSMMARQARQTSSGNMFAAAEAPPPPTSTESDLVKEIRLNSQALVATDSVHKKATSRAPVGQNTFSAPQPAPPSALAAPRAAVPAAAPPTAAPSSSSGGRPEAPRADNLGKPIPEWKRKILQRKLDAEYDKEQSASAEIAAKEARWVGVPVWKRAMIEAKEAEADAIARGEVIPPKAAAAPEPAKPKIPDFTPAHLKAVISKKPVAAAAPASAAPKFDPFTGQPLAPPAPRFDPMTGKPLGAAAAVPPPVSSVTGATPSFMRGAAVAAPISSFPTTPPQNAPSVGEDSGAIAEWKLKLLDKKKAGEQARIDDLRKEKEAKEARWIGVPAWKRKIIEEKERAMGKR